jgi:hypothetical protein
MSRGEPTLDELVASAGCGHPQPGFVVSSEPPPPRKRARCDVDAVEQWDGAADEVCVTLALVDDAPTPANLDLLEGAAWGTACGVFRRVVCPADMTIDEAATAALGDHMPKNKFRAFVRRWTPFVVNHTVIPFVVAPSAQHTVGWVARQQGRALGGKHLQLAVFLAPERYHELPRRRWTCSTSTCMASQVGWQLKHIRRGVGDVGIVDLKDQCVLDVFTMGHLSKFPKVWVVLVPEVTNPQSLPRLPELLVLTITRRITDGQLKGIVTACPALRRLAIPCVPELSDDAIRLIAECQQLEMLNLRRVSDVMGLLPCPTTTEAALVTIVRRCRRLRSCTFAFDVSDAGLRQMKDDNPQCDFIKA